MFVQDLLNSIEEIDTLLIMNCGRSSTNGSFFYMS